MHNVCSAAMFWTTAFPGCLNLKSLAPDKGVLVPGIQQCSVGVSRLVAWPWVCQSPCGEGCLKYRNTNGASAKHRWCYQSLFINLAREREDTGAHICTVSEWLGHSPNEGDTRALSIIFHIWWQCNEKCIHVQTAETSPSWFLCCHQSAAFLVFCPASLGFPSAPWPVFSYSAMEGAGHAPTRWMIRGSLKMCVGSNPIRLRRKLNWGLPFLKWHVSHCFHCLWMGFGKPEPCSFKYSSIEEGLTSRQTKVFDE